MYKEFYGLRRKPFEITPDPAFFFPTPRHNEALANLSYGVRWRKGFVVLTGEVGTGKTLLLGCLLDLLKRVQIACALIVNTRLTSGEFLRHLVADLQVPTRARDKSELLLDLNKYLIERCRRGSTTVLIVDEAHLLSWEVLEEIRLLGNLETTQEKQPRFTPATAVETAGHAALRARAASATRSPAVYRTPAIVRRSKTRQHAVSFTHGRPYLQLFQWYTAHREHDL
jgi:type II secretory pathway predicted ATPase ExeA